MLKTVADRMETMDIHLDASDEAVKELARRASDPKYGARPCAGPSRARWRTLWPRRCWMAPLKTGDTAKLAVEDDKLVVTK